MSPETYIFIGLIGGSCTVGLVVFCVVMLRSITTLNTSVNEFTKTIAPLLSGPALVATGQAMQVAANSLPVIAHQIAALNTLMSAFNKVVLDKNAIPANSEVLIAGEGTEEDSIFMPHSESEVAERYRGMMERQQHYPSGTPTGAAPPTPPVSAPEPSPEQIVRG